MPELSKECFKTCPYARHKPGLLKLILGNAPDGFSDIQGAIQAEDSFRENLEHAQVIEDTCIGPEQLPPTPTILRDPEPEYRCRLGDEYVVEVFGLDKQ